MHIRICADKTGLMFHIVNECLGSYVLRYICIYSTSSLYPNISVPLLCTHNLLKKLDYSFTIHFIYICCNTALNNLFHFVSVQKLILIIIISGYKYVIASGYTYEGV